MEAAAISRFSAQRALKRDLGLAPIRKVQTQRENPTNEVHRLEICRRWGSQIRIGEMGM